MSSGTHLRRIVAAGAAAGLLAAASVTVGPAAAAGAPRALVRAGLQVAAPDRVLPSVAATGATVTAGRDGHLNLVVAEPAGYRAGTPVKVMVFFHGGGRTEWDSVYSYGTPVTAGLLEQGYVVVSERLAGTSYGNPAAMRQAALLGKWISRNYNVQDTIMFSMSMGSLPAMNVAMRGLIPQLHGWIGASPICNLHAAMRNPDQRPGALAAWAHQSPAAINDGDPLTTRRIRKLRGLPMQFLYSPGDSMVPPSGNARACAARAATAGAKVELVATGGQHGEPGNYPVSPIIDFANRATAGS